MEMRFIRPLLGTGRTPKLLCEKGKAEQERRGLPDQESRDNVSQGRGSGGTG